MGLETELDREHQALIDASAISPEVAADRGYSTARTKSALSQLGFSERQCRVPALLIPIRNVHGEIANYQIRPDRPRIGDRGKALKYETPRGSRMSLDVPVAARSSLCDPGVPLFITEGARKADAGVSAGLCTIALLGVWNFRGRNEHGGKTALSDWEVIALNERKVYIVFDSDVMEKEAVNQALVRLKGFLESRGAVVRAIYLEPGPGATKIGLDDFLALGNSVEDLLSRASAELREPPHSPEASATYEESGGRIIYNKRLADGAVIPVELANFSARIVEHVIEDDGAEARRFLVLEGIAAGRPYRVVIPAERFASMSWVCEEVGPEAIMSAGYGNRDRLREAVQRLSPAEIDRREVYLHLGWREVGGEDVYLHAGGAIGARGTVAGVDVRVDPPLDRFVFPKPPVGAELVSAIGDVMRLLDGPGAPPWMFPLFPILWRGTVSRCETSAHLYGTTGVRKTEVAALLQRFFGNEMDAQHLPGSWSGTANSLEGMAFLAKDALYVVDDFNPTGARSQIERAHSDADRLIRGSANGAGRSRMRADGSLVPPRPPRGTLLSTGEEVPRGHSLRARLLIIEVGPEDVDLEWLSECQRRGGSFSGVMSAFISWVAPQRDELRAWIRERTQEFRDELLPAVPHGRTATTGADLQVGLLLFLRFATSVGGVSGAAAKALAERGRSLIVEWLERQSRHQLEQRPEHVFLECVGAALLSGAAHLVDRRTGDVPCRGDAVDDEAARVLGWRLAVQESDGSQRQEWRPSGPAIGYVDLEEDSAFLIPPAAMQAARKIGDGSGTPLERSQAAVVRALDEAGMLQSKDKGRRDKRIRVLDATPRAWHLSLSSIVQELGTLGTRTDDGCGGAQKADFAPESVPNSMGTDGNAGASSGNGADPEGGAANGGGTDCPPGEDRPDREGWWEL